MTTESEKLALHFKYCTLILTMIIIGIATDRWTAQKDFTAYLSNAATMTSLLLGLVAIFYSFISNDSLSKSLGSITTVSSEVKETKEQISQYLNLTKEATFNSTVNANQLQKVSTEVSVAIDSLSNTLKEITEQNKSLQTIVTSVPIRIDQLEINLNKVMGEKALPTQSIVTTNIELSETIIDNFLNRTSLLNNLLTYACVLAFQTKKPLSVEEFCKAIETNIPMQAAGFMSCMNAVNLITRKKESETDSYVFIIEQIHPLLLKKTKNYYESYINSIYDTKVNEKNSWLNKLASIEKLFV